MHRPKWNVMLYLCADCGRSSPWGVWQLYPYRHQHRPSKWLALCRLSYGSGPGERDRAAEGTKKKLHPSEKARSTVTWVHERYSPTALAVVSSAKLGMLVVSWKGHGIKNGKSLSMVLSFPPGISEILRVRHWKRIFLGGGRMDESTIAVCRKGSTRTGTLNGYPSGPSSLFSRIVKKGPARWDVLRKSEDKATQNLVWVFTLAAAAVNPGSCQGGTGLDTPSPGLAPISSQPWPSPSWLL